MGTLRSEHSYLYIFADLPQPAPSAYLSLSVTLGQAPVSPFGLPKQIMRSALGNYSDAQSTLLSAISLHALGLLPLQTQRLACMLSASSDLP